MTHDEIHKGLCEAAELIGWSGQKTHHDDAFFMEDRFRTILHRGTELSRIINYEPFFHPYEEGDFFILLSNRKYYSCFRQAISDWFYFHNIRNKKQLQTTVEQHHRLGTVHLELEFVRPNLEVMAIVTFERPYPAPIRYYGCEHPDCVAAVRKFFLEPYPQGILMDVLEEYVPGFSEYYHRWE